MPSKLEQLKRKRAEKDNPNLAVLEEMRKMNEGVEELKKKEYELELLGNDFSHIKGDKGDTGKAGDKGQSGETGTRGEQGERGKKGDKGTTGKQGNQGQQGQLGENGRDGSNGKPPKHEVLHGRMRFENPDGTWGAWIDIENNDKSMGGKILHRGGLDLVREDLSSQCDGATIVFTLTDTPKANTVNLHGTQFPIIYRPTVDFTVDVTAKTVTLDTGQVAAPEDDQTLVVTYIKS